MLRLTIDVTEQEYSEIHSEASKHGLTDQDFIVSSIRETLPLYQRSDDEIGEHLRAKYRELYRRLG